MQRRTFLQRAGMVAGFVAAWPFSNLAAPVDSLDFPLLDLHVHRADSFSIKDILDIARERGVRFGIVEHPAPGPIRNDADLRNYIADLRKYPVLIGLQPTRLGWSKRFSPELLAEVDYVLMDPQAVPVGNGEFMRIWEFKTYVEDTEEF